MAAAAGAGGFEGFGGFSDIFDAFFGGGAGAASARRGRPQPGADLRYDLRITFEEAVKGTEKEIEFTVLQRCETCHGSGAKAGHGADHLPAVQRPRRDPLGPPDDARPDGQRQRLPALPGRGQDRRDRRARPAAATAGRSASGRIRVTIPAGIDEGHQIRLSNEGEVGPRGGPPGSLYVAVHVLPHPSLKREGTELYYEAQVSIAQAALGTRITVPTVDGEEEVEIKAGTQPGHRDPAPWQGRPAPPPVGARGDLHVLVDVVVPTKLSKKAARAPRGLRRGVGRDGRARRRRPPREARPGVTRTRPRPRPTRRLRAPGWRSPSRPTSRRSRPSARSSDGWRPAATSVEPAFELVDEGLGARVDPTPAGDRARLRPRPRSPRPRTGPPPRSWSRSAISRPSGCGRSASYGPGSSTRPTGPTPGRRTSRSCGSGAGSSSDRPGGATAGCPATSSSRSTRGWRSGPGSTRRRGCASRRSRRCADRGVARRRARPRRRLWLGHPGDRGAQAGRGQRPSASTPTRSRSRRRSRTRDGTALVRRLRAREGSLPSGAPAFDVVLANLIAGVLVPLAPALRGRTPARRDCSSRRGSSSTARRRSPRRSRRPGLEVTGRGAEGDWVALEASSGGAVNGPEPPYNRPRCPRTSRSCSSPTSSWPSA